MTRMAGMILIGLGLIGLIWGGFSYTTKEKVVDIGPLHATRDQTHYVWLPPVGGALMLAGGVVMLLAGRKA